MLEESKRNHSLLCTAGSGERLHFFIGCANFLAGDKKASQRLGSSALSRASALGGIEVTRIAANGPGWPGPS